MVKILSSQCRGPVSIPGLRTKIPHAVQCGQNKIKLTIHLNVFPGDASGKETACQCKKCRRYSFHPWIRKILWRRKWQPISVFLLENPMDKGAWQAIVHGVAKSWTQLSTLKMVIAAMKLKETPWKESYDQPR